MKKKSPIRACQAIKEFHFETLRRKNLMWSRLAVRVSFFLIFQDLNSEIGSYPVTPGKINKCIIIFICFQMQKKTVVSRFLYSLVVLSPYRNGWQSGWLAACRTRGRGGQLWSPSPRPPRIVQLLPALQVSAALVQQWPCIRDERTEKGVAWQADTSQESHLCMKTNVNLRELRREMGYVTC